MVLEGSDSGGDIEKQDRGVPGDMWSPSDCVASPGHASGAWCCFLFLICPQTVKQE